MLTYLYSGKQDDWDEKSDEAELLFELGLERHPRMEDLLVLAAPPNGQATRAEALQYFFENFERLYDGQYNPSIEVAFLPTINGTFHRPLVRLCYCHSIHNLLLENGAQG